MQEGLWNPNPQNKNVSLYALSQSAQKCNYGSHFISFPLKIICHFIDRWSWEEGKVFLSSVHLETLSKATDVYETNS